MIIICIHLHRIIWCTNEYAWLLCTVRTNDFKVCDFLRMHAYGWRYCSLWYQDLSIRDFTLAVRSFLMETKVPPGCLLAEPVTYMIRFSMPLEPSFDTLPLSSALSQLHIPLWVSALTNTTDNSSEMCPLKLLYHWSCTILQGLLIPPMASTSCHDQGSNRLPPEWRASTLITQPVRHALMETRFASYLVFVYLNEY